MRFATIRNGFGAAVTATLAAGMARAQDGLGDLPVIGAPVPNGTGFHPAATELAHDQQWLDAMLHYIMAGVVALVLVLLAVVIVRYNSRTNPNPARFTHNTPIEITWTVVPIVILVVIGSFSLPILFKQQEIPEADVVIKATGYQWYWGYEYPDEGIEFRADMIGAPYTYSQEENADPENQPYVLNDAMVRKLEAAGYTRNEFLLATDNPVVVPVNKNIVVQVTAADVIHSWTIPAFAVKQDAVPGRIAELWFNAEQEGIYFGQCSELCGKDHAYMPITVKVVSQEAYEDWLQRTKEASLGAEPSVRVAATN